LFVTFGVSGFSGGGFMKRVLIPMATSGDGLGLEALVRVPYIEKLSERGVMPVLLPPMLPVEVRRRMTLACEGLLLIGGVDVDPALYGATRHPRTGVASPIRDSVEIELARQFVSDMRPVFGVCRGAQVLNVAFGGTLHQHVPEVSAMPHRAENSTVYSYLATTCWHNVTVEPHSKVAGILGATEISMNSVHHQAVDSPGNGIRVVGRSIDGIAEFFEHCDHPFCVATQAHPEAMSGISDKLWDAFVAAL
jgi:putative glutamine amidotransferase